MEFQIFSVEQVLQIHQNQIQLYGGQYGHFPFTIEKIDGILAQLYPLFGYDKYQTIFQKAAALFYFFTKDHCFIDGNKRIAIQCAIIFLTLNGYEDHLEDNEGYEKTIEIAVSTYKGVAIDHYIDTIAAWLADRFK
ncbi:MAG TPA: type II toxin-antitoxin system death-on-curing family toxin [Firmicutes bacterium]|jgi:death on curing protein|nr:type II toxin-antitoxin system death-on-curing family toxin [Bacillota bacterium]